MAEPSLILLCLLFMTIAFVYGSVGLGGGSSYTALLFLLGFSHVVIPTVSLSLNTIVSSSAAWHYFRAGHVRSRLVWPFLVTSIPAAYIGGSLEISARVFQALLLATLVLVAARIYLREEPDFVHARSAGARMAISLLLGAVLGFVAGVVGIGGGIYLVPLILILGLGEMKEAAAAGAVFIFINSISGLIARAGTFDFPIELILPLGISVLIGGGLGSWLGAGRVRSRTLQRILGVIILAAIALLIQKLFFVA